MTLITITGDTVVVKTSTEPSGRVVAVFASGGKARRRMIGIGGIVEVWQMALFTASVDTNVVKAAIQPGIRVVAVFASGGEAGRCMIGIGGAVVVD